MAWNDLNDMPWLQQGANTGDSLMRGAQLGSLISNGMMQRRELEMRQAQFQQEQAIMPLKQKLLEMQVQGASADIANKLGDNAYEIKQRESLAQMSQALPNMDYSDPQTFKGFLGYVQKHPWLMDTPVYQHVVDNFGKSAQAKIAADRLQATTENNAAKLNLENLKLQQEALLTNKKLEVQEQIARAKAEALIAAAEAKAAARFDKNSPEYRGLMGKISKVSRDRGLSTDDVKREIDALVAEYKLEDPSTSDTEKELIMLRQQNERLLKKGYGGKTFDYDPTAKKIIK